MGSFVQLCLLPELWSLKCQKWLILCICCWIQQNISSSLDKIFKCICKVSFGPFRKQCGLRTLELPLTKFQRLKMQDFIILFFTQKFFCLLTISHEQLSPKPINHTIFCNNSISSLCTSLLLSAENTKKKQKNSDFSHFKDHRYGSKHDNQSNDLNFLLYSLSSIHWYVSRLAKFNSMGSRLCIKFWSVKYTFKCQIRHF